MSAIEVRNVAKRFGDVDAVVNATFSVPYGAVTGFVGGNGSGKTTTMRMIAGLSSPDAGELRIDGAAFGDLRAPREVIGCALDRLGAHPGMTARQHVRIVAAGAGLDDRTQTALEEVGLLDAADRKIGTYSTGMKQRLALATALLGEPRVLMLDEPARGLDPDGVRWLRNLLRAKADSGAAVFVSTHQLAELAEIVDHVVVIARGHVVAAEPIDALLARNATTRLEEAVFAVQSLAAMEPS